MSISSIRGRGKPAVQWLWVYSLQAAGNLPSSQPPDIWTLSNRWRKPTGGRFWEAVGPCMLWQLKQLYGFVAPATPFWTKVSIDVLASDSAPSCACRYGGTVPLTVQTLPTSS